MQAQNYRIQEPTGTQSYEAMVGGMSRARERLSRKMGEAIEAYPGKFSVRGEIRH